MFFTNGAKIADPMPASAGQSRPEFWNRMCRQTQEVPFVDVTDKAGLSGMGQNRYGMGVAVGDYDNDGFQDIYVTNFGANTLYRNNGNGTFTDVTARAGVASSGWSASAGFFDYDNDGRLDLFVTRYLTWAFDKNRYCGEEARIPRLLPSRQLRRDCERALSQRRQRHVHRRVGQSRDRRSSGKGLGLAFADYDDDGFIDVYVANDSVQSFLYHNKGGGTFDEVGLLAGVEFNEDGKTFAGMGVDFSDYDNDGRPDVFVTDLSNEQYRLFRHNGDGSFRDVTNASGVGGATLPFAGWSTRFFDYDNDGWKDIFVAQGHVMDNREDRAKLEIPPTAAAAQRVGTIRAHAGEPFNAMGRARRCVRRPRQRRGCRRGREQRRPEGWLLRNDGGNRKNWLASRPSGRVPIGTASDAASRSCPHQGSQFFTINTAVGYLSASDKRLIVGLGDETLARLVEIDGHREPSRRWKTSRPARRSSPRSRTVDDQSTRAARPAGVLGASGVPARDLLAGRQAASAREAVWPPFPARFTDVAKQAGLVHPVVYGGVDKKTFIVEVVGCGVAFLDYDNDGWLDVFVLSGTRLDDPPSGTTNRLYKNNRNGTFTDVTEKAGLLRTVGPRR